MVKYCNRKNNVMSASKTLLLRFPLLSICRVRKTLVVWRNYHSSIYLHEKTSGDPENEKLTQPQPIQFSGYNALVDSAKEKPGMKKSEQFEMALNEFKKREKYRKGHVPFIRVAMQRMDEFGLEEDLSTYNKILDIFPRGKFAPRSMIDAFWPRSTPQLELCLELLTKMEENGVRPSLETYNIVKAVFGRSFPLEKCIRVMYLFDIYRDMDPYEIRAELPTDPVALSRLALFRMTEGKTQLMEIQVKTIHKGIIYCVITRTFRCLKKGVVVGLSWQATQSGSSGCWIVWRVRDCLPPLSSTCRGLTGSGSRKCHSFITVCVCQIAVLRMRQARELRIRCLLTK